MKILRNTLAAVLSAALAFGTGCAAAENSDNITVMLSGSKIEFDVQPQMINDRTMVPLRKIFESLGALVKWDDETETVSARKSSKTVSLTIGSSEMTLDKGDTDENGNAITETVSLDAPAQMVDDRTLVPLRAVSEAFGMDVDWDEDTQTVTIKSDDNADDSWKQNTGAIDLTSKTASGDGVTFSDSGVNITKGGDFTLSGTLNGSITVSCDEKVKLRLGGASITSGDKPCIYIEQADKAYITLESGSDNTLDSSATEHGALYSKENLEIKGDGSLNINSAAGHGIKASDNLTIESGKINITAAGDGVNVNDTLSITGGEININAACDGIDCESIVNIEGGSLNITTTLEPTNAAELTNRQTSGSFGDRNRPDPTSSAALTEGIPQRGFGGGMPEDESVSAEFETSAKGLKADWMLVISGGELEINSTDHAVHCADEIEINGGNMTLASKYCKGISGHGNVTINNGDINVTKCTEGIESKNILTINDGKIRIVSSDDSLNAGGTQGINFGGGGMPPQDGAGANMSPQPPQGNINENMPPQDGTGANMPPQPPQGNINENMPPEPPQDGMQGTIPSFDPQNGDMPHRGGGRGGQGGGMPGGNAANLKTVLIINGGDIECSAGDDCYDANGNMILNGGTIKGVKENGSVTGPNSVFDPDGSLTIGENATIIAAARSGFEQNTTLSQNTITLYTDEQHSSGDTIQLVSSSGDVIAEYTPAAAYSAIVIVSPEITIGETYTAKVGDETHSVNVTEQISTIGAAAQQRRK